MARLWVIDLDNTLMDNVHDYSGPILDAVRLMIRELGLRAPHPTSIINLLQKTDEERRDEVNPRTGKPFRYSMDRFPGSLARTYQILASGAKVLPRPAIEKQLVTIGRRAFDARRYRRNVRGGAAAFTHALRRLGDCVVLLSKGDVAVQQRKIKALKAAGVVFDHALVVESDKAPELERLMMEHVDAQLRPPDIFSVGDSYEGDIEPALKLGYRCIWIPVENWEQIGKITQLREKARAAGVPVIRDIQELNRRLTEF